MFYERGEMMQELEKLGAIMSVLIENCSDCPLEKICTHLCNVEWEIFFKSKVKEDGVDECKN